MSRTEDDGLVDMIARKHQLGRDAVATALQALRSGGGRMAQFSHPEFGGMAQWSRGGMSMIGDMFNTALKARFEAMMAELARAIAEGDPATEQPDAARGERAGAAGAPQPANWWKGDFGAPSSSGSQNEMRYAFFPDSRRLVVDDGRTQTIYDTGDLAITGVSQQQSGDRTVSFSSQNGPVALDRLTIVS